MSRPVRPRLVGGVAAQGCLAEPEPMQIRPTHPEPSRRLPPSGPEATPVPPSLRRSPDSAAGPAPAPALGDRAELSSAAHELFARLDAAPSTPALTPERTRSVLARLAAGNYDRPEVLDRVARGILAEPQGS